jgi:hypothetical protein
VHVIAEGLDNPRGLALGPDGALYVAEGGRGGPSPCVTVPGGDRVCFGDSGAITRVGRWDGHKERVLGGLPSLASELAAEPGRSTVTFGPTDVAFSRDGTPYLTVGLGGHPALRDQLPPASLPMATLYRVRFGHGVRPIVDLGTFEAVNNPDAEQPGSIINTNPYAVAAGGRGRVVVTDAGANDILAVGPTGAVTVLGVLPFLTAPAPDLPGLPVPPGTPIPVESVPTGIVRGPGSGYYVSQFTGFPFPVGDAAIWCVTPGAGPTVAASGFTQVTDLAFGPDGSLYVLELATGPLIGPDTPGALIRVRPDGTREELAPGRLERPVGLALDGRYAYVTNRADQPGTGEVVRIRLPSEARRQEVGGAQTRTGCRRFSAASDRRELP